MPRLVTLLFLIMFTPIAVSEGVNIYLDIDGDVTHDETSAPRLKLRKQNGLELGRMAGVWGSVGNGDTGDAFFLGKTPIPARMQFTLVGAKDRAPVELIILARDGAQLTRQSITAQPGETVQKWLALKGRVTVKLRSPTAKQSLYAAYFWYPGKSVDGMSPSEFNLVKSGHAGKVVSFARRAEGRAGR